MELPYSEELNIGYLSRLFSNTSNCYKFFWFQAILNKLDTKKNSFTFDELIHEMIADAWYMVTEYHLRLGPNNTTDNLEEIVKYICTTEHFMPSEKREKILSYLENCTDKILMKYKRDLTANVPYRLQAPFYDEIYVDDKWYGSKEALTAEINQQKRLIYYFRLANGLESIIEISPSWTEYLLKNREILRGWLQLNLIHYLQNKNPSVPGIADKLYPSEARDLDRVRKYWKLIIKMDPLITDIYGDVELSREMISIDHFVPWQYVAHDELWNLHPTTRSINSSKSNSLPEWEKYFGKLGSLEYSAYQMRAQYEQVRKEFDSCALYHLNNQEIRNQLYQDNLGETEFKERLFHVLHPVYTSAKNSGFQEWFYER